MKNSEKNIKEEQAKPISKLNLGANDGGIITRYAHEERSVTRQAGGMARLPHTPHGLGYTRANRLI